MIKNIMIGPHFYPISNSHFIDIDTIEYKGHGSFFYVLTSAIIIHYIACIKIYESSECVSFTFDKRKVVNHD